MAASQVSFIAGHRNYCYLKHCRRQKPNHCPLQLSPVKKLGGARLTLSASRSDAGARDPLPDLKGVKVLSIVAGPSAGFVAPTDADGFVWVAYRGDDQFVGVGLNKYIFYCVILGIISATDMPNKLFKPLLRRSCDLPAAVTTTTT